MSCQKEEASKFIKSKKRKQQSEFSLLILIAFFFYLISVLFLVKGGIGISEIGVKYISIVLLAGLTVSGAWLLSSKILENKLQMKKEDELLVAVVWSPALVFSWFLRFFAKCALCFLFTMTVLPGLINAILVIVRHFKRHGTVH